MYRPVESIEEAIEVLKEAVSDEAIVMDAPVKVRSVIEYLKTMG